MCSSLALAQALQFAIEHQANVINLSLRIHAALSGDIPGGEAHRIGIPAKSALTAGASFNF